MNKPIAIIAGEPNSISSEIIFKTWKIKKKFRHKNFFIIGSINLLKKQQQKLKINIKLKEINDNINQKNLNKNFLPVYNVDFNQKKPFSKISTKSNKYIFNCFNIALKLIKNKKIHGFINCPVSKESLFKDNHQGITEYLSNKISKNNEEVMLIFNKELSVTPITTHIPLKLVNKKISIKKIVSKVKIINTFYKKFLKRKARIGILGLNPHNFSQLAKSEEKIFIKKAIKILKKSQINVKGPISSDSSFINFKKFNLNVLVGMYHDQVLTPFKALYKFNAINVTLGLPYVRVSPDHGVGEDLVGKNIANYQSLVESIKFFNYIK
jgi:4-hydroxythreonine-4-phosphate dehydrogenase